MHVYVYPIAADGSTRAVDWDVDMDVELRVPSGRCEKFCKFLGTFAVRIVRQGGSPGDGNEAILFHVAACCNIQPSCLRMPHGQPGEED